MPSDPRDYKLDLSGTMGPGETSAGGATGPVGPSTQAGPAARPFLSVHFACCGAYQRVYRAADGGNYEGRCPRCGRPVKFVVGEGGTSARAFVAR
jgi:hypothetical protein